MLEMSAPHQGPQAKNIPYVINLSRPLLIKPVFSGKGQESALQHTPDTYTPISRLSAVCRPTVHQHSTDTPPTLHQHSTITSRHFQISLVCKYLSPVYTTQMFKYLNVAFKKLFFILATLGNLLNGANNIISISVFTTSCNSS